MKNVFFVLAFMIAGTFAFANTSVENELKIENTSNLEITFSQGEQPGEPGGTCSASYNGYNRAGEVVKTYRVSWSSESAESCAREAKELEAHLNK